MTAALPIEMPLTHLHRSLAEARRSPFLLCVAQPAASVSAVFQAFYVGGGVFSHLIKTASNIKSCGLRCVGGQTYFVKMHGSIFQQLHHQGPTSLSPTVSTFYVYPAKPSNS